MDGTVINIDTVAFANVCIDLPIQAEYYPAVCRFRRSNVPNACYYITLMPCRLPTTIHMDLKRTIRRSTRKHFTTLLAQAPVAIKSNTAEELADLADPEQLAINVATNEACLAAEAYCLDYVEGAYTVYSDRSGFDMAHKNPDPFPPYYAVDYFNQKWVQEELGAPVNFTADSATSQKLCSTTLAIPCACKA